MSSSAKSRPKASPATVSELLDRAFREHASRAAIEWQDAEITYAALDQAADRISRALAQVGAGVGSVVAILLRERVDVIASLIATLRAGCIFAPLDLDAPPARLEAVLSRLAPSAVITDVDLLDTAEEALEGEAVGCEMVVLEWRGATGGLQARSRDGADLVPQAGEPPRPFLEPGHACYIYHTSGSTGEPKGIVGSVKGLSHFIRWEIETFGIDVGWRFSQVTAPSFDAFLRDVLVPLCAGGTVCVPPERETVPDPVALAEWLDRSRVRVVHCVPTLFSGLVRMLSERSRGFKSLQTILMSGEVVPVSDVARWMDLYGDRVTLVNLYGPTETTMIKFCHIIRAADLDRGFIPIGKPIDGASAAVLDETGTVCPPGVVGEIHIRTPFRTLGYYRQPELTREAFVPNPFNDDPEDLLYRTGDLGRVLHDRSFQLVGRRDHQVKVRGVRVELGEIEVTLAGHPAISRAVVELRMGGSGDAALVAYMSAGGEAQPSTSELRRFLRERLFEYMIPATFVWLSEFPLSPNGKVDRGALPAPDGARPQLEKAFVAPRSDTEKTVAQIWCDVLRVDAVGVHDDFFDLGGHSLLGTQVIARVRERFELDVPLRVLFDEPTVEALASAIDGPSERFAIHAAPAIEPSARSRDGSPLSFAQERLWFLDQLLPGNPVYNMPYAVRMTGPLDILALKRTLREVVRRHEVLRTRFPRDRVRPVQIVDERCDIVLSVVDLATLAPEAASAESEELMRLEAQLPFDLTTGPLVRASVLLRSSEDRIVLFTMHHIASDAWSLGILMNELTAIYQAFAMGAPSPLPELEIQYGDFAQWQRDWFQGPVVERQLAYWRDKLDAVPALELPTDRPLPLMRTYSGSNCPLRIDTEVTARLRSLGREQSATPFMIALAAFGVLLSRHSGQEDFAIGSPIANRTRSEIEGLIGFFVNTLVLRLDLSGDPSFRQLVDRVRETALEAYAHQDLPFEKLVDELQPDRNPGRQPLFQVMLGMQNAPLPSAPAPGGPSISPMRVGSRTAKFDLTLFLLEYADHIIGSVEFSTELFDEATVSRMVQRWRVLLEAVATEPDRRLSSCPLLTESERRQLTESWTGADAAATTTPQAATLSLLFEEQAGRTPESVAVVWGESELSYATLDAASNRLARHLSSLGVGPDVCVGLCLERSPELVVAVLGIVKAGGAYVPLDPDYPVERLAFMLSDTRTQIIVTEEHLLAQLPESDAEPVCLSRDWARIGELSDAAVSSKTTIDHIAYVIYTSGSTGIPKGVAVPHGAVSRLVLDTNYVELDASKRMAQASVATFDAATFEIWGALLHGSRLVGVSRDILLAPDELSIHLREQGVSVLFLTTALFNELARETPDVFATLSDVLFGGEAVNPDWVRKIMERGAPERLLHVYGPTETTTFATWQLVESVPEASTTVPIGGPVTNTKVFVLDRDHQPVPIGVTGELYIGGAKLARGYLSRAGLTGERFVPDGVSQQAGGRLYRTGDLVRWTSSGALEFQGRLDSQVKLRGFRIELGEIESILVSQAGVREAVVVAREDKPGDKRLVAYVVPDPDYQGTEPGGPGPSCYEERVSAWQDLYDDVIYSVPERDRRDPAFDTTGWISSYDDQRLSDAEMREQVDQTVERILRHRPERVLEIGCGTGMLLARIAPSCREYQATDFSDVALSRTRRLIEEEGLGNVVLAKQMADDFSGVAADSVDAVVLNSVVQYFPGIDYLRSVLDQSIRVTAPGGMVFIGDVKHLPTLDAFHATVQLHKASPYLSRQAIRELVERAVSQEQELVIDPAFFHALHQVSSKVGDVEIQLKRGHQHNELTIFRYDVVLHIGPREEEPLVEGDWLQWSDKSLDLATIERQLEATQPVALGVRGVPNGRLIPALRARELLAAETGPETAGEIRETAQRSGAAPAVDPENLWELGTRLSYSVDVTWSVGGADDKIDVLFRKRDEGEPVAAVAPPVFPVTRGKRLPWSKYATNPLRGMLAQRLVPELGRRLREKLPEYMVPTTIVTLDALPLTRGGKIHRQALPRPEGQRPSLAREYVAARNLLEEQLSQIWSELLGIERVGVHDNFFELGGHSLLATQLVSRVRRAFDVDLPLRAIFDGQTIADLAGAIGEGGSAPPPPILPVPRDGALPLSFAQQRLWFLDRLEPGKAVYNVPGAVRLTGWLNVAALRAAFNEIVLRHETLRTIFSEVDGRAVQIIEPSMKLTIPMTDLSGLPESARDALVRRLAREEAAAPFDLRRGPLIRVRLLRAGDRDHVILLTMHHIASDGWSMGILVREIATLYTVFCMGRPSPLPKLSVQYADFAHWQRNWLRGDVLDEQLQYWKRVLSGLQVLNLPTDRPRPRVQSYRGKKFFCGFAADVSEAIQNLGRSEGVTTFMALLAVFQLLMSRYSGQTDVAVGSPVANRNRSETEALIGFFVNSLVLRLDLSGDPPFREFLGRVREVALGAYAHQDLPFEKMVDELQPARNLSHQPLFQVGFALQNTPMPTVHAPVGVVLSPIETESDTAKFELFLSLWTKPEGFSGYVEYSTDLFDAPTIARMVGHLKMLLEGVALDPDRPLSSYGLLTEGERRQLTQTRASGGEHSYPESASIGELFESQAHRTPDAVAVVCGESQLSYGMLDGQSNRLARHLRDMGVGPDVCVGVCLQRSPELVLGLLGISKAGGAYVPLAPDYPSERLAFMLRDTRARVLLTEKDLLERLPESAAEPVCLSSEWGRIGDLSAGRLPSLATGEHLAYITYTSGSTGTPKGVEVCHRGVSRLLFGVDYVRFGPLETLLHLSSVSFDASTFELWGALLHGGRSVLYPDRVPTADGLGEVLGAQRVTTLWLTASLFNVVIDESPEALMGVQQLVIGGEALSVGHVKRALRELDATRIINGYGPTESTTFACCYEVPRAPEAPAGSIPIGAPIGNTRVYVLDREQEPVPIGVVGELHIGGAGLARGYLSRRALTAERFVPDGVSGRPAERLYRTGDMVRWLSSGVLEFQGRADGQVKLRGFRVELGEIESAIVSQAGVREAVVVARETRPNGPGDKRLVAYVVFENPEMTTAALQTPLERKLPGFMIPTSFVALDALPLGPTGKLDRSQLPVAQLDTVERRRSFVPPRTAAEEKLARIWSDVLGIEQVGVHDNFFELGGDSILSIQVVARAVQGGLYLTPKLLFEHQTIATLAPLAGSGPASSAEQGVITGPLPLMPIQRWFFEQDQPDPHYFNQTVLLNVGRRLEPRHLLVVVHHLLEHHDALRSRFEHDDKGWTQRIADVDPSEAQRAVVAIDVSQLEGEHQRSAIEQTCADLQAGFDLRRGPMMRLALFDTGTEWSRVLLTVQHLVVDGVSWRILLQDMMSAYELRAAGASVQLPPKTASLVEWSERFQQHVASGGWDEEIGYWRGLVGESHATLPTDLFSGANDVSSAEGVVTWLEADETRALLQEVPHVYRTQINDVLLTALVQAFSRWTGQSSLVLHLEGHGREALFDDVDLSRTVGWFTTIFPVELSLDGADDPGTRLQSIKEQLRRLPGRGVGYGALRYLHRDPAVRSELESSAQVSFNYLGQLDRVLPEMPLALAPEFSGPTRSRRGRRAHLLEVNGGILGGRLQASFTFSRNIHHRATVEKLAADFTAALGELVAHCRSTSARSGTPSDFPLARLDQPALDRILEGERLVEDIYPATPLQSGLLFHSLYAPDLGEYFEQFTSTLQGEVDLDALERAWRLAVDHFEILRTGFEYQGLPEPMQVVQGGVVLPWSQWDWSALDDDEQRSRLEAFLEADRRRGFDLSDPPLMRVVIIQRSPRVWTLVWSFHHILLDGWSLSLLLKAVFFSYEGFRLGHPVELPRPRPFRDYIAWLVEQDADRAERFWREKLRGFTRATRLQLEPSTEETVEAGLPSGSRRIELSEELTQALQELARRLRLSANTIIQGVWTLLLSRYAGEDDVVFGVGTSGRPPVVAGVETMLGLFVSVLPMRARVRWDGELVPWLRELQAEQVELRQYEYSSLVDIHGWSEVPRGAPLFDTAYVLQNYPMDLSPTPPGDGASESSLKILDVSVRERFNYRLTLLVSAGGGRTSLRFMYDRRRFDEASIQRMLEQCCVMLEAMVSGVARTPAELPFLGERERQQLLVDWSHRAPPSSSSEPFHRLFEAQARKRPDALALVHGERQLTYRQTEELANHLANRLVRLGVEPESVVGVCMERSAERVVSLLAVMKAGAAYLSLDPAYPPDRLAFQLADARASVLLTADPTAVPEFAGHVLHPGNEDGQGGAVSPRAIEDIGPDSAAYVIYTSGSTGSPKGVVVQHRGLCNLALAQREILDLSFDDRVLQFASPSFDASVWEVAMALGSGATLVVVDEQGTFSGEALGEQLQRDGITLATLTPSILRRVPEGDFFGLRALIAAGEACSADLVERWSRDRRFFNAYGPTETTVCATLQQCEVEDVSPPPIGVPLPGMKTYVLDRDLALVPTGIPGELCVGGVGLARGYSGRPAASAPAFVPDPFAEAAGERLYRTGDLVRWSPDGRLQFLGRVDRQTKLRGVRVEPGEVERVLMEHRNVDAAAVTVSEDPNTDAHLVAHVVLAAEGNVESKTAAAPENHAELRAYLSTRLPAAMVPTFIIDLPELPTTPSGKVDYRKLQTAGGVPPVSTVPFVAPSGDIEPTVAQIWCDAFGRSRVGVMDDFFELGGHSMMATQIVSRINEAFLLDLPIRCVYQAPNVKRLAETIGARLRRDAEAFREMPHVQAEVGHPSLLTLRDGGTKRPLFFVHSGTGSALPYLFLADTIEKRPVYGLQAPGLNEAASPVGSVEDMARSYVEAVRSVQADGPYLLAGHSAGAVIAFEMSQQLSRSGGQVKQLFVFDAAPPGEARTSPAIARLLDDDSLLKLAVAEVLGRSVGKRVLLDPRSPERLASGELTHRLHDALRAAGAVPADSDVDLLERWSTVFRDITQAIFDYRPGPLVKQRITVFQASDRRSGSVMPGTVRAAALEGWNRLAVDGLSIHRVPGDHFSMLAPPGVDILGERLAACLESET